MTDKKLLWLAIAAGIAAVVCVELYVSSRATRTVDVYFAKKNVPEGGALSSDDFEARAVDADAVPRGVVTRSNDALLAPGSGVSARTAIRAGSPVFVADLASVSDARLSTRIPDGHRALAIPVTRTSSLAHMIYPDDRVELLVPMHAAGEGGTVLHRVPGTFRILAVGSRLDTSLQDAAPDYDTVTLVVTPEEAERIASAIAKESGGGAILLLCPRELR